MKFKVLVSGKNKNVIRDVCEHLELDRGYLTVKCPPSKAALFDTVLTELPRVIILCLGDETSQSVKGYDVLADLSKRGGCPIIVVTNEEDEKVFINYSALSKVLFLKRPVSLMALYAKLAEMEDAIKNGNDVIQTAFKEYHNDNPNGGRKRKHILVVDDDSEQLITIKDQLDEFYDVTPVKSGDAALKFLTKKKPDLILLDYMMPKMDGAEALRRIRTVDDYSDIPVVFLTGTTEKTAVLRILTELRPQGYIVKPAKKSKLVAKIIDLLG